MAVFNVIQSILGHEWVWRGGIAPDVGASGDDDLIAQLFRARGANPMDFDRLRAPTLRDWLPDPSIFRDMDSAAARIADAVAGQENIVIYGDYDVDGATSAALLVRLLRGCGGRGGRVALSSGEVPAVARRRCDG